MAKKSIWLSTSSDFIGIGKKIKNVASKVKSTIRPFTPVGAASAGINALKKSVSGAVSRAMDRDQGITPKKSESSLGKYLNRDSAGMATIRTSSAPAPSKPTVNKTVSAPAKSAPSSAPSKTVAKKVVAPVKSTVSTTKEIPNPANILSPSQLKSYKESDILRKDGNIYRKDPTEGLTRIAGVSLLKKYKESELVRGSGGAIYLKKGVAVRK